MLSWTPKPQSRRAGCALAGLMLAADSSAAVAAHAAGSPPFDVPAGVVAAHPCRASYQGRPLFAGRCMVNTKDRETMVFSPRDGCTFTLVPAHGGFTGKLSAYRNSCVLDAATEREVEEPIALGPLHRAGACGTGAGAQVCVER